MFCALGLGVEQKSRKPDDLGALATANILNFPNIVSFTVSRGFTCDTRPLPSLLSNSWITLGPNLRQLTVSAQSADFPDFLPAARDMVSLEDLTLRFHNFGRTGEPNKRSDATLAFLREVSPKLHGLHITVQDSNYSLPPLFDSLGRFPKLISFSLLIDLDTDFLLTSSRLTQFLNKNAATLKHVRIQPHKCSRTPNSSDEVLLSNLETLSLLPSKGWSSPASLGRDTARTYIMGSQSTLKSLYLNDYFLTLQELSSLLDLFAHAPDSLKTLAIRVWDLNPQLFDMLAEKLVGLERLEIQFEYLTCDASSMQGTQRPFREMRDLAKEVRSRKVIGVVL